MTKFRWNESMNMFRDHVDPEKEEQLKRIIIETDAKVNRILKLVKGVNSGNREAKQRKRSEAIQLIEQFHEQYQSLYALYNDLKEGVKRKCNSKEEKEDVESSTSSSSASMESAAYYSPASESKTPNHDQQKATTTDGQGEKSENSSFSLEDTSEVVKEALSVEPVSSSYKSEEMEVDDDEVRGITVERLMKETGYLRERLGEREKEYQNLEKKSSTKMKELEARVIALKLEIEALNYQKGEHEQEFKSRDDEIHKRSKVNSGFQSPISELEFTFQEKEDDVFKKLVECEKIFKGKIDESMGRVQNLLTEVDFLRSQREEARKNSYKKEKELESLRIQNTESGMELKKKTKEVADSLELLESLTEELKRKTTNEEGLVEEKNSLKRRVKDLEGAIVSINDEARLSKSENGKQRTRISQLEEELQEKEGQISTLKSKTEGVKRDMSNEKKSLEQKCKSLEIDKRELEEKNDVLARTLEERDILVSKLNHDAKSSFRTMERKMEEMAEEFRKKSEDSIRLLSRRIRVAEQLHMENKEWYKKTKDKYEQDQRENELAFHNIKLVTETVSDTLSVSETLGLRFVECCEHFMNRVSKASCEINFVKDWVKRKNGAIAQVREDFDTLLVQLDDKEEEILGSRQKVWKLENRVRELEKMVTENDEAMIVLKEEKREAIRQLCVWIDYHRSRSDFFKKAFSDFVARNQRPA